MKINTKETLKGLKNEDLKLSIGDALATILVTDKSGGKMKLYILATKLSSEEVVELDAADKAMVKSAVENTEAYNALVTGQLLLILSMSAENKA